MLLKFRSHNPFLITLVLYWCCQGCTFNFELTSQKTALENQVTGKYKELDDELILISTVRSGTARALETEEAKAAIAVDNRKFNMDDIDELKTKRVIGETKDGYLTVLGKDYYKEVTDLDLKLARIVVGEENRDRETIWKHMIKTNENLSDDDLKKVRAEFAISQRDTASEGEWIETEEGNWIQIAPKVQITPEAIEQGLETDTDEIEDATPSEEVP